MSGHELDGLAGTQKECGAAFHITEDLARQINRRVGHRDRVFANGGIRAHLFRDPKGFRENQIQVKSDRSCLLRHGKGGLHLPEDLGFAQHHGVQTGGHSNQVRGCRHPVISVNRGRQLIDVQSMVGSEPLRHLIAGAHTVHVVGQHAVELCPVACGQDHRLAELGITNQGAQ